MLTIASLTKSIYDVNDACDSRLDDEGRAALDATLALDFEEYVSFQNLKSIAAMDGTLSLEVGNFIYAALDGETPGPDGGWAAGTSLATKVVLTKLHAELLALSIARKRAGR